MSCVPFVFFTEEDTSVVLDLLLRILPLLGALAAGLLCGLGPLVVGILRGRIAAGITGFVVTFLCGLLRGLLLAVPVALLFSAAIIHLSRGYPPVRTDKPEPDRPKPTRYPVYCLVAFGGTLLYLAYVWLALSWLTTTFPVFTPVDESVQDGVTRNASQVLSLAWASTVLGVVAIATMLLRYRAGAVLGYVTVLLLVLLSVQDWRMLGALRETAPTLSIREEFVAKVGLTLRIAVTIVYGIGVFVYYRWVAALPSYEREEPANVSNVSRVATSKTARFHPLAVLYARGTKGTQLFSISFERLVCCRKELRSLPSPQKRLAATLPCCNAERSSLGIAGRITSVFHLTRLRWSIPLVSRRSPSLPIGPHEWHRRSARFC